jgi:hypothetical protein
MTERPHATWADLWRLTKLAARIKWLRWRLWFAWVRYQWRGRGG